MGLTRVGSFSLKCLQFPASATIDVDIPSEVAYEVWARSLHPCPPSWPPKFRGLSLRSATRTREWSFWLEKKNWTTKSDPYTWPLNFPTRPLSYPTRPLHYPTRPLNYTTWPLNFPTRPLNYTTRPPNYSSSKLHYPITPLDHSTSPLYHSTTPLDQSTTRLDISTETSQKLASSVDLKCSSSAPLESPKFAWHH